MAVITRYDANLTMYVHVYVLHMCVCFLCVCVSSMDYMVCVQVRCVIPLMGF